MKIIWQNSLVSKGLSCNGWLGGVGSRKSSIDCPDPESKTNLKKIYKVTWIFRKRYFLSTNLSQAWGEAKSGDKGGQDDHFHQDGCSIASPVYTKNDNKVVLDFWEEASFFGLACPWRCRRRACQSSWRCYWPRVTKICVEHSQSIWIVYWMPLTAPTSDRKWSSEMKLWPNAL